MVRRPAYLYRLRAPRSKLKPDPPKRAEGAASPARGSAGSQTRLLSRAGPMAQPRRSLGRPPRRAADRRLMGSGPGSTSHPGFASSGMSPPTRLRVRRDLPTLGGGRPLSRKDATRLLDAHVAGTGHALEGAQRTIVLGEVGAAWPTAALSHGSGRNGDHRGKRQRTGSASKQHGFQSQHPALKPHAGSKVARSTIRAARADGAEALQEQYPRFKPVEGADNPSN